MLFMVSGYPDGFPFEASDTRCFSPEIVFAGKPVGLGLGQDHEPPYGRREGIITYVIQCAMESDSPLGVKIRITMNEEHTPPPLLSIPYIIDGLCLLG